MVPARARACALWERVDEIIAPPRFRDGHDMTCVELQVLRKVKGELLFALRLFYGCSYMFYLSGDNSRDRYIKGS